MSAHERDAHERLLEDVLVADDPRRAFESSDLAACVECRDEFEALQAVTGRLDVAGRDERTGIELAAGQASAPGEGAVEETVRGLVHARAARPGAVRWLVAAAGISVAVFALWRMVSAPRPVDPGPVMGTGAELLRPVGGVEDFGIFEWNAELSAGGYFVVRVYDAADRVRLDPLTTSPRIERQDWSPTQEELEAWPDRIYWEVTIHSASTPNVETLHANAERSSP